MHPFERHLSVSREEITLDLSACGQAPWLDFLLNPRRLRGSDFLMRWSQGRWSEDRLIQAVNDTARFIALPYGPSGTAPQDDVREFELYFERLEAAGLGGMKRPDLLVFSADSRPFLDEVLIRLGGIEQLPFTPEEHQGISALLSEALLAVECENSLWKARNMPAYGVAPTPQRRLNGRLGVKKSAVLPTVITKEEDRAPLVSWQRAHRVPIHVWHVFYDLAYGMPLDEAERLVTDGLVEPTRQIFQAPGGATTAKIIYKYPYFYAYELGDTTEEPTLSAASIEDRNGHILPYVRFEGGRLRLSPAAVDVLTNLRPGRELP